MLPLFLPKLATAALTPTLVIVFSAEAWDIGFHMSTGTAALFTVASILAASVYLLFIQNLSRPRKRHRVFTEHRALVNVTVLLVLVVGMVGLFVLAGTIILAIQLIVFPPNPMSNWPGLQDTAVGLSDLVRTGAFISTISLLSGALAAGLENRDFLRHLTLFRDEPRRSVSSRDGTRAPDGGHRSTTSASAWVSALTAVSHEDREDRREHRRREGDIEYCEQYHQDRPGDPEDRTYQERDERYLYAEADDVRDEQDDEADDRIVGQGS